tara:strand:- start:2751 stop:3134 length:384 start_codon:yes stop_codon:yes gene_type:complete
MHLVGPYMTTTSYKKRKAKNKTKKMLEAEAKHDKWLRKMNAHPEQIAKNKEKNANVSILSKPDYSTNRTGLPTSDIIPGGSTGPKERQVYSGERQLLGIATMHKSNMVPVFADKKEDAVDIAKMRRG